MPQGPDQLEREVQEAMRVQTMTADQRQAWLRANWDRLQRTMNMLYASGTATDYGAISFETLDAKNAHDEQRELEFALRHAPAARARG